MSFGWPGETSGVQQARYIGVSINIPESGNISWVLGGGTNDYGYTGYQIHGSGYVITIYKNTGSGWGSIGSISAMSLYVISSAVRAQLDAMPDYTGSNVCEPPMQPCPVKPDKPGYYWPTPVGDPFMLATPVCTVPECSNFESTVEYSSGKHTCIAKTCPEGFIMNSVGSCVCPETMDNVADKCLAKCKTNEIRSTISGNCVPMLDCDPNTKEWVNGVCTDKCQDGQTRNPWGECSNQCLKGQHFDVAQDKCVPDCEEGKVKDQATGQCVTNDCNPGFVKVNNICVDSSTCPGGNFVGGVCVKLCKDGESQNSHGDCVKDCPAGSQRDAQDKCVPIDCGKGKQLVNNACVDLPYPSQTTSTTTTTKTEGTVDNGTKENPGSEAGKSVGSGTVTGGQAGQDDGGTTGDKREADTTDIDYSGAVCPAGSVSIGDGVCQAGESEWSSDCAGSDYLEHRFEKMESIVKTSDLAKLTSFGNYQGMSGSPQLTTDLGNFGGVVSIDFSEFDKTWAIMAVVLKLCCSILCIKIILLKKS